MIQLRERVGLNSSLLLLLLLFTKLSNGKLVTEKSGKWESGNPLFLPQFCSHCTFESFASVLMSLKWCTFALLSLCRGYWLLISKVDVWKEIQLANCPRQGFFSVHHLSFMVMSADWCTSSSQVCMSSTSVLTPFEKSCMHNKLQNLFSKGHGCTPFYVSKKAKKLFFVFRNLKHPNIQELSTVELVSFSDRSFGA